MIPSLAFVGGLVVDSRRSKFHVADPIYCVDVRNLKGVPLNNCSREEGEEAVMPAGDRSASLSIVWRRPPLRIK